MKVVRIITRLNVGGPARQVKVLKDLPGVETLVVAGRCERGEQEMFEPDVRVEGLGREIGLVNDLRAYWGVKRVVREFKPDLVHTHTSKAGAIGRAAARRCGIPCIHTFHGHVFQSYFGRVKTQVIKMVEKGLSRISSRVIAISPSQYEELGDVIGREKLVMICNGFDFGEVVGERTKQEARLALGLPKWGLVVAFIGRLVPVKDVGRYVEFCERYLKNYGWTCIVVGDGPEREKLPGWIIHYPFVEDMRDVYKAIDHVVLCSKNEGVPTVYIEAVVNDVGTWCLTIPGGVKDLVKMTREEIRETFQADRFRKEILELYKEVLKEDLDESFNNRW